MFSFEIEQSFGPYVFSYACTLQPMVQSGPLIFYDLKFDLKLFVGFA